MASLNNALTIARDIYRDGYTAGAEHTLTEVLRVYDTRTIAEFEDWLINAQHTFTAAPKENTE